MDFDEAVLFHKSFLSWRYANSFLQVAAHQQNWAASTWDLLRPIWPKWKIKLRTVEFHSRIAFTRSHLPRIALKMLIHVLVTWSHWSKKTKKTKLLMLYILFCMHLLFSRSLVSYNLRQKPWYTLENSAPFVPPPPPPPFGNVVVAT